MIKKLFSIFLLCTISLMIEAQSFQIMRYGIEDGLCHESTSSLIQDSKGYIWISTTQGLCRLDGIHFNSKFLGDTLPNSISTTSFKDSQGRVWFGHVGGEISLLSGNRFKVFLENEKEKSSIIGFAEDQNGNILAMTQQNGLIVLDEKLKITKVSEPFEGMYASSILYSNEGILFVGSFDGITIFSAPSGSIEYEKKGKIAGLPFTRVQDIEIGNTSDSYWVGTEDEGFFRVNGSGDDPSSYKVFNVGIDVGLDYSSIYAILTDNSGFLWLSDYGAGVYRFNIDSEGELSNKMLFDVDGGLPEEYIKDILKDDEGNIWFASQSNGVAILRDQSFVFYDFQNDIDVPEVTAISMKGDDYWFGSRNGVLFLNDKNDPQKRRYFLPANGLPSETITSLWQDEDYNLYIGTESSGVFLLNIKTLKIWPFFVANNSLGNSINALDGDSEVIWIASNDGVYSVNRSDGKIEHQSTSTGLPHNVINDILIDMSGRVWIATKGSGIYRVNADSQEFSYTIEGNPKLEFVSLAEDEKGQIWAASAEDGVFMFADDSLKVFSLDQGLKAKYTYAIGIDPKGYIWVGHRLGLSRINPETGNIAIYNQDMGFTSDILHRAIEVNDEGLMLFGTNNGLIVYNSFQARQDTIPPRLNISELNISDSIYDVSSNIKLPYGAYKIRIDFVGINLSNPDQVLYRYKMDGFDDWSEPTRETYAKYSRIEDGNYTFMLSACDGNGNCTGEVAMINIDVKIPIWKAWWFIVSLFLIAIVTVFTIIKIRERNQKALQEYLERQLDERTREVIHQKEEIEIKNRDITDSINYAQRIQASILPPIQRLHNTFSGSFVFYQPRDIVSGDFYWYDKLDDDRFMIVCADSTGHGVPGAFMSMIGTTLIKDIVLREGVNTPSDVLKTLDNEVRDALNQNKETDGSNDGMDIIVAEFNLKTNKFVVSSAMRPVILYMGEEQIYVKGSRSSVGGQLDDENLDKEFANEEFDLKKGDIVYMFSDGYPDQFGGPLGRKFKMVRLKNLLRDIHDKPMDEQYNYVKSNFFLWKEDLEQVDDVLFMGIKV